MPLATCLSRCRANKITIVGVLVLIWAHATSAADGFESSYAITPVPGWVAPIEAGDGEYNSDMGGGEQFMLVDRQYRDDGKQVSSHRHMVTRITGQAGLSNNSKLSVYFDPAYQRLELHTARVLRNGQVSDRLQNARISVARTEDNSNRDLQDGAVTALVVLSDIRVGDQVEYRYTIHGRNPVFDPRHFSDWQVRWSVPVERSVLRITVPESMPLTETIRPEAIFSEQFGGGLRTVQWLWEDLAPSTAEGDTTDWYPDPDRLEVSAYRNWSEVAAWGTMLFKGHAAEGAAYRMLSTSIQQKADTDGMPAAIAMAIDNVQKNIRYYGLELGENSHRPHAPDEVLRRGYGDCKDKALLLVSLLEDLGVRAWPLLVSSRNKRGITDRLPSPGVFDHVVVLVEHSGRQYWVDATDNSQSGLLGYRGQPEYGAGVVLGMPGVSLITRDAPVPDLATISTHDKFFVSSVGGPVDMVTTTTYRGRSANEFRWELGRAGLSRLQDSYRNFYSEIYGKGIKALEPLRIEYDNQYNTITTTETYRFNRFWTVNKRARTADFTAYALSTRALMTDLPEIEMPRRAPVPVSGPVKVQHRLQFFPSIASPERELETRSYGFDGFKYQSMEYVLADSYVFDSKLDITTDELTADDLEAYRKFKERVMINSHTGRYYRQLDSDLLQIGSSISAVLDELGDLYQ